MAKFNIEVELDWLNDEEYTIDEEIKEQVIRGVKDELLRGQLGLEKGKNYTYRELCQAVSDTLTEKAFLESCINCMWYQQGLCDYRALMENIKKLGL